eukprot:5536594-Pleurochrysis_carterae.AAC.1
MSLGGDGAWALRRRSKHSALGRACFAPNTLPFGVPPPPPCFHHLPVFWLDPFRQRRPRVRARRQRLAAPPSRRL